MSSSVETMAADREFDPELLRARYREERNRRLRKDGSLLEVIDGHYVARAEQGAWLFNTAVACAPGWRTQ